MAGPKRKKRAAPSKAAVVTLPPVEAVCLACRLAPSWPALAEKAKAGELDRADAREGIVQTWREFFNGVAGGTSDPADVGAAMQFFRQWPRLYRLHCAAVLRRRRPDCSPAHLIALEAMHEAAERIIVAAAERAGLDGSSVALSGEHCRQVLDEYPKLGDAGNWPECLNFARKVGPRESRKEIREADRVMLRLEARLPETPAQGDAGAGDGPPADLIAARVALKDFQVSRPTLYRCRKAGRLAGYRPVGATRNAEWRYSRADLARLFTSHKKAR